MSLDRYSTQNQGQCRLDGSPISGGYVDAGLRDHLRSVYNTMVGGLLVTAATVAAVGYVPAVAELVFGTPLRYVVAFGPLLFIFFGFTRKNIQTMPLSRLKGMFFLFSGLLGASMSYVFAAYDPVSLVSTFLVCSSMFAGASLYGYVTKRSLDRMGALMVMGLIGLFVTSLVTMVLSWLGAFSEGASPMFFFVISAIGVIVFTGLTAWETQIIKESYDERHGADANARMAYQGAFGLYLNFINLFQYLLYFTGGRR